ncbi:putative PurR-regulated permease PerM [Salipiger aestuarii]|uniref:Putative PurR-regulated permease PerM n=2 Tax=Salipiger aestuarii TaxID=568098 RepID=A0A327YEU7_9RHOB|nr:putative PurR-regulated permease PerM [Salipiger aestuarii]
MATAPEFHKQAHKQAYRRARAYGAGKYRRARSEPIVSAGGCPVMKQTRIASDQVSRVSAVIVATGVVLVGLKYAQDIAAPLVLAIVVGVIVAPLADRMQRLRIPRGVVALSIIIAFFFAMAALVFVIEPYVTAAIDQLPSIRYEIRKLVFEYRGLIQGIGDMNDEMKAALGADAQATAQRVAELPSLTDAMWLAPAIFAQMLVFLGGLFFFLLTRGSIYRWMSGRLGTGAETHRFLERFYAAESMVSRYFAAVSMVNAGLGLVVGVALITYGLPGAVVWGVAAALLNFVLYLGPAAMAAGLLLAGIVNYDGIATFVPMAIYLACNMTEAQFVTPTMVGKHIQMNPFLLFAALIFWLWLWGPIGGIVAIPVTLIFLRLFDILGDSSSPPAKPAVRAA